MIFVYAYTAYIILCEYDILDGGYGNAGTVEKIR